MFRNNSLRTKLTRSGLLVTSAVLIFALGFRQFFGSRPWPETTELLPANAVCEIEGRIVSNHETETDPIRLAAGQRVTIQGDLRSWDYRFSTPAKSSGQFGPTVVRDLSFLMVFRQMRFLANNGTAIYDGNTSREVIEDGAGMTFIHSADAPATAGQYRLQLLALERSPQVLAKLDPLEGLKPIGVLAEALVQVEP